MHVPAGTCVIAGTPSGEDAHIRQRTRAESAADNQGKEATHDTQG